MRIWHWVGVLVLLLVGYYLGGKYPGMLAKLGM